MIGSALSILLTTAALAIYNGPLVEGLLQLGGGHVLSTAPASNLVLNALRNHTWYIIPTALLGVSLLGCLPRYRTRAAAFSALAASINAVYAFASLAALLSFPLAIGMGVLVLH